MRNTVRILLLNENKLLLMRIEDFDISAIDGNKNKIFWCTIGGKIEDNESIERAALREIYEETGITKENVELGPVVWFNEVDLNLKGNLTRFKESYIVAKTKQKNAALAHPTQDEQDVVKELKWFSMQAINDSKEIIFPVFLKKYLPDIISDLYPKEMIIIE